MVFWTQCPMWNVVLGMGSKDLQTHGAAFSRKGHLATPALLLSSGGGQQGPTQTGTHVLTPHRNNNNKNTC